MNTKAQHPDINEGQDALIQDSRLILIKKETGFRYAQHPALCSGWKDEPQAELQKAGGELRAGGEELGFFGEKALGKRVVEAAQVF